MNSKLFQTYYKYYIIFTICTLNIYTAEENDETILYYYGLEESERSLQTCEARQACAALLQRYWRPAALLRLCRCGRRQRCDTVASPDHHIELNNRAQLQFCKPVTNWTQCSMTDIPLQVQTTLDRMNPDDLEDSHHHNIQLTPPKITLECRCRVPNYWKLKSENDTHLSYQCTSLPLCKTNDVCGNVSDDLLALYQSCLCPKNHMCVHNGGLSHTQISELLYYGKGWRAYCQPITDEYDYDYTL